MNDALPQSDPAPPSQATVATVDSPLSAGSSNPRRGRPRRFRRRPVTGRLVAYVALAVGGAGALLWFVPIRSAWLDGRIRNALEAATGLRVDFEGADYYIGRQRASLPQLRLSLPPDSPESGAMLGCRRADITFSWADLLRSNGHGLAAIQIVDPTPLEFVWREGKMQGLASARIWHQLRQRAAAGDPSGARRFVPATIHVLGFEIRMVFADGDLQGRSMTLSDATLEADLTGDPKGAGGDMALEIRGRSINGEPNRWRATLSADARAGRVSFDAMAGRAALPIHTDRDSDLALELTSPRLFGVAQASRSTGMPHWSGFVQLTTSRAQIKGQQGLPLIDETNMEAQAEWSFIPETAGLEVKHLTVTSPQTDARAEGTLSGGGDWPWRAELKVQRLPGAMLDWIARRIRTPEAVAALRSAQYKASLKAEGSLRPRVARLVSATAQVSGIDTALPGLELPLSNGELDAEYTTSRLTLRSVSGSLAGGEARLYGVVLGDALGGDRLEARLLCQAEVDLEKLAQAKWLAGEVSGQGLKVAGRLSLLGDVRQQASRTSAGRWEFGRPRVNADVSLTSGVYRDPRLPRPIEDIHGTLNSQESVLSIRELTGRLGEAGVRISGRIDGNPFFWVQPEADLQMEASLSADDVVDWLPAEARREVAEWRPSARAAITARARGPLRNPAALALDAAIHIQEGHLRPNRPDFNLPIQSLEGTLAFDGQTRTISIERLRGAINEIAFECAGRLTTQSLALDLTAPAVDLRQAQQAFPRFFRHFDVGGVVAVEARIRNDWEASQAPSALPGLPPVDVTGVIDRLRTARDAGLAWAFSAAPQAADAATSRVPCVWARIKGQGVRFTHENMPTALDNISGEVFYADGVLFARDGRADFGVNKGVQVHQFAVATRDDKRSRLWFDVEAADVDLTEWFRPWRKNPRGSALEVPEPWRQQPNPPGLRPPRQWTIEIGGQARARTARWRRHEGKDFQMTLSYGHSPTELPTFVANGSAMTYAGTTTATMRIVTRPGVDVRWQTRASFADVALKPFLSNLGAAPSQTRRTIDGKASGYIELQGVGADRVSIEGRGMASIDRPALDDATAYGTMAQVISLGGLLEARRFENAESAFEIHDRRVHLADLTLTNADMRVVVRGSVGFDKSMDVLAAVNVFKALGGLDNVPVLSLATRIVGAVGTPVFEPLGDIVQMVFQIEVTGTLDKPKVAPAPFSRARDSDSGAETGRTDLPALDATTTEPARIRIPLVQPPQ